MSRVLEVLGNFYKRDCVVLALWEIITEIGIQISLTVGEGEIAPASSLSIAGSDFVRGVVQALCPRTLTAAQIKHIGVWRYVLRKQTKGEGVKSGCRTFGEPAVRCLAVPGRKRSVTMPLPLAATLIRNSRSAPQYSHQKCPHLTFYLFFPSHEITSRAPGAASLAAGGLVSDPVAPPNLGPELWPPPSHPKLGVPERTTCPAVVCD